MPMLSEIKPMLIPEPSKSDLGRWVIELVDLIDSMLIDPLVGRRPQHGNNRSCLNAATWLHLPAQIRL